MAQLSDKIVPAPYGGESVGVNYGLHFTGGEPFLNYPLLLKAVEIAEEYGIPSVFVETNSFWCVNPEICEERLKDSGLDRILISVNPFLVEYTLFERMDLAVGVSRRIFGSNTMIYQLEFYGSLSI